MQSSQSTLTSSDVYEELLQKATNAASLVIINMSKLQVDTPGYSMVASLLEVFCDTLTEITAIWMSGDKGQIDALLSGVLSNPNLLEMLFTFIFKSTKMYSHNAILKNSMIVAAKFILKVAHANQEVKYKILSSGLLLAQVSSLKILSEMQNTDEAAALLSSIHLQLLHCCFADNPFCVIYAFYETEWFNILSPLVNSYNKAVHYMAKFVACHVYAALFESHKALVELSSAEVSLLLGLLNTAASSNEPNVNLAEANISFTMFELLHMLSMFTLYPNNRIKIASNSTLLPTLATLLVSAGILEKAATCLLILRLSKEQEFKNAFALSELPFNDILHVLLDEENNEWVNCLISSTVNLNFPTFCVTQLQTLHKLCLQFESNLENNVEKNYTLLGSLCKLLEIVNLNIADCQVFDNEHYVQKTIAVLASIVTKLLCLISSNRNKVLSCLPSIIYHILNWVNPQSGFTDHILVKHMLGEISRQLKSLSSFEWTWFTEFLVKANFGIIISILNDDSFISISGNINWIVLLKPWLKCESQNIKTLAMLIGGCLANQFAREGSLLKPHENDEEWLLSCLEKCVNSTFHGVPLCNNLFVLTLKVLIMSLHNRLEHLQIIHNPIVIFKNLLAILESDRTSEIKQVCRFLCTYGKCHSLDQLIGDYEPLLTKLVGAFESKDNTTQADVAKALQSLQGYPASDIGIDESNNPRDKHLCNAVRIIASILKCLSIEEFNFDNPNIEGTQLQLSLTEMWHAFKADSDSSSINANEYLIAAVDSMCSFVEKIIKHICVNRKMVNQTFLNCLSFSLALMALWSNESVRIRFQIMRTELLVHLGNLISFLDTSEDKSFEVLNAMMMNAATIFCNCVKEKDFVYLYTLPGVANWTDAIQEWMTSNYLPLYFKAKIIYGFMAHGLENNELYPLTIREEHLDELLEVILQATTTESFSASLFEWKFHIAELIASLCNFVILETNFLYVAQISSVPVSLLLILNYGNNAEKKAVCRLLLMLLKSSEFAKEIEPLGIAQVMEDQIEETEDCCLKFLSQIVTITLQNRLNVSSAFAQDIKEYFKQLLDFIYYQITLLLKESEGQCIGMFYYNQSHCQLIEVIDEMYSFWCGSPLSIQTALIEVVVTDEDYLQIFHSFLSRAYKALYREEQLLGFCFIKLSMCLLSWAQRSTQFCHEILQMGLLLDYVKVIMKSSLYVQTNFNTFVIAIYTHMVLQCVKEVGMQAYLQCINWFQLLSQLASSINQEFCIVSKLIAGCLIHLFSESEYDVFRFNNQEANMLISLLNKCAVKSFSKEVTFIFEVPLLCLLDSLIYIFSVSHGDDGTLLNALKSDSRVFMSVIQMLKFDDENIKISACGFLWVLLENFSIDTFISSSAACELRAELSSLKSSNIGQHHVDLIDCLFAVLNKSSKTDINLYKIKANTYYALKNFSQCVQHCNEVIKLDDSPLKHYFLLLKGKALYFSYTQIQRKLNKSTLTEDIKRHLFDECYSINKQCIQLLGNLCDEGLVNKGEQEFFMLNRAMMDCIFQANQLDSCARCYLCLNNPQKLFFSESTNDKKGYSDDKQAADNTGVPASLPSHTSSYYSTTNEHYSKKRKLIKSHTIPKSVLQALCTYEVGKSKRTLYSPGSSIKVAQKRLIAPGEMVYYMLCHDCEELLSRHGETQFLPGFIKKIHTCTSKQKIESKELFIDYGPWLYQFCVGLIFRTMYLDAEDFVNNREIMEILHVCRMYLLSLLNHAEADIEFQLPSVHIFISPSSVGMEEIGGSYMTVFLQDGFYSLFSHNNFHQSTTVCPTFFVKKIGVVNICVSITSNSCLQKFSGFAINKDGGVYWVPTEAKRRENFPEALWSAYQISAKQLKQIYNPSNTVMTASITKEYVLDLRNAKQQNKSSPLITDSVHRTLSLKKMDVVSTSIFLPPQFTINHAKRQLILPKGHTVLLHANYVRGHKKGSTFFVAIGNDKLYSPSKPYVLWYFYEPDSIVSGGAFFSLDTLEVTNFLFDDSRLPEKMSKVDFSIAKEKIPSVLKDLIQDKGFSSVQSLLYRVTSSLDKYQCLPHFDTKCKKDAECWYCRTLCHNCCQKEAAFGRTAHACNDIVMFCSKHCQGLSPEHYISMEIFDLCTMEIPSYIFIHCAPLSSSHRTLQHVFIRKLNNMNFPCEIEIAVCVGDGTKGCPTNKVYVVFYSHHLFHQLFLEFFINSQLMAEEPLPHNLNENAWKYILKLNDAKSLLRCFEIANVAELLLLQIHELANS